MKYFFFLLLALFAVGCADAPAPGSPLAARGVADSTAAMPDTVSIQNPPSAETPALASRSASTDYLTAVGNEPGWMLKMKKTGDGSFPVMLVYSYGMDTLTGAFPARSTLPTGKTLAANQEFHAANLNLRGKAVPVEVLVTQEKCTDDAGTERPVQVKLTVEKSWHPGCGSFAQR